MIASGRMAFAMFCAAFNWSDRRITTFAAPGGSLPARRPPTPVRELTSESRAPRSSDTTPPLVLTAPLPPLITCSSRLCARRFASSQSVWTRGRWRAWSATFPATLRRAPAAGPDRPLNCAGSALRSSPWTSTFA